MHPIAEQFKTRLAGKNWLHNGERTLLALSGGVDSMVMAQLFLDSGYPIAAAHCNYRLRGADSDADEALVAEWCRQHNVPFFSVSFETEITALKWKKGIQETARILRYEWLDQLREEQGCKWLATAHHADDNVETLLMHLFKGTGIAGLHGIPEQNGRIIRPLYFATKVQIRDYALQQQVPFREDASNSKDIYDRNAIRNRILPAIEEHFPQAVQQMQESIHRFAQAEQLYREAIEQRRKKLLEQRGQDLYVPILKLRQQQPLETIVYELFIPYGFGGAQTEQIIRLMDAESGRMILSATHRILRHRDFLVLTRLAEQETDLVLVEGVPATVSTPGGVFHFSIADRPAAIPDDPMLACIRLEELQFPLILRKAKTGDYFYPLGMGRKKKKLSRYLIDRKLGQHEKEKVWLLESNRRIAWVAGLRLDERFKIGPATEKILMVTFKPL